MQRPGSDRASRSRGGRSDVASTASGAPGDDLGAPPSRSGRNLPIAVVSGLALAGLLIGSLYWHPAAFSTLVLGLAIAGAYETGRTFERGGQPVAVPVLVAAAAVAVVATYLLGPPGQVVALAFLFVGSAVWKLADRRRAAVVRAVGNTSFLGLWIALLASYAVLLVDRPEDGPVATLAVVGAAALTDVGGYAFGVMFGRRAVAPTVSPKKTWEGLVGGLATAAVAAVVILPLLGELFSDRIDALVVALAAGLAGFFGDLFESMFKRDLGIKDMGSLLPGHGGILDRVDGILLALPVGYYALELVT